ncbi:MAG: LacI family DNA-binding transcriptional regulator [Planctomycetota bacterium]
MVHPTGTKTNNVTVTLADIARRCNLSKGSVSRALSMSAETCPLSPATRLRVLKVSQEMGYRVNSQARALARGKSMAIGLVYEGSLPILDSVYHEIVDVFSSTLRQHGYHLELVALDDTDHWEDALMGGRVDGCICLHSLPERVAKAGAQIKLPIVLLNGRSELVHGSVSVDDRGGAVLVTEHLLGLGHRRIVMLTDTDREMPHYSIAERQNGFLQSMREAEAIGAQPMCFEGDAAAFADAWHRMSPKPTAVICYSHVEAIHALRVLRRAGVDVPGQVSLATFNDVFPVADLDPALTCVNIQASGIGRVGGEMLLRLLKSPASAKAEASQSSVLAPILIERESTAAAPN